MRQIGTTLFGHPRQERRTQREKLPGEGVPVPHFIPGMHSGLHAEHFRA